MHVKVALKNGPCLREGWYYVAEVESIAVVSRGSIALNYIMFATDEYTTLPSLARFYFISSKSKDSKVLARLLVGFSPRR